MAEISKVKLWSLNFSLLVQQFTRQLHFRMKVRIHYLFGGVEDPISTHNGVEIDEDDAVDDFQELLRQRHSLKEPAIELWKVKLVSWRISDLD